MIGDLFPVCGGSAAAFTLLQSLPVPMSSIEQNKNLIIAGIVSCASQLLIKLGNKLILQIGRRKRVKKALIRRHENQSPNN